MKAAVTLAMLMCVKAAATTYPRDHRIIWLKDLYRGDQLRLRPFGPRGIPCRRDWLELSRFFRDRHGHRRAVAPALVRLLAQIQRHFAGRPLHLMSGYRAPDDPQALSSYHQVGHSADVWIDGVKNRDLFEYCRALQRAGERLGCGLYPVGDHHVHVDVRSSATIWVDLSGYGDGAVYVQDVHTWLAQHPDTDRRPL
jgi:uncharacterized protein YcbK (DUF882 family)